MRYSALAVAIATIAISSTAQAGSGSKQVGDDFIAAQRAALAANTDGKGYGPQSPRDIDVLGGSTSHIFGEAPSYKVMNLCNIHFHKNAEHKGGEFNTYAGNGDGQGYMTGYVYSGTLTDAEKAPLAAPIANKGHGGMQSGDTIEVHYVHTTAEVGPGQTLGACLHEAVGNPQLRVETQVFVLVNDETAHDFMELTKVGFRDGHYQALNILTDMGGASAIRRINHRTRLQRKGLTLSGVLERSAQSRKAQHSERRHLAHKECLRRRSRARCPQSGDEHRPAVSDRLGLLQQLH